MQVGNDSDSAISENDQDLMLKSSKHSNDAANSNDIDSTAALSMSSL